MNYRYDMHTHSSGSYDSELDIFDTIEKLRNAGYSGMVITDHDTFKGFNGYFDAGYGYDDFAVIKGIEITTDVGHVIAIPPSIEDTYLENMEGAPIDEIIEEAKKHSYLIGLAHPYCEYYGVLNKHSIHNPIDEKIIQEMDFLECYNYGVPSDANELAEKTADTYGLAKTGGSDSHVIEAVGNAYTDFSVFLEDNEQFVNEFKTAIVGYGKSFDYCD